MKVLLLNAVSELCIKISTRHIKIHMYSRLIASLYMPEDQIDLEQKQRVLKRDFDTGNHIFVGGEFEKCWSRFVFNGLQSVS